MRIGKWFTVLSGFSLACVSPVARAAPPLLSAGAHYADLGAVKLHYVVRGAGPLLLVASPGWGPGSHYLQKGLQSLESTFTLVYIDMRGSGGSSRPADRANMSQSDMADDIEDLRKLLRINTIDLLGHSDGGTIAIEYAERHPAHVRRMILIEPAVQGDRERSMTEATLRLWANDPQYSAAVREVREQDWSTIPDDDAFARSVERMVPLYIGDPARDVAALSASLKGAKLSSYAAKAEGDAEAKAARDQVKDLPNIRARTLIINGTADWICPYPVAQRLNAAITGSQLSLYANKGHFPWIEAPARFFEEVTQFMRKP
ncbi:alpha/beta fold hydrolase [Sphingomonas arantia]|uniref:Alpha/beta fold hydrolase n=1 Tax=Sphingomonas arantia TaxID=1460676 RepID=A0ABW4TYC2_9SPHN